MMSFAKDKLTSVKALMALVIVADHMALFYGVSFLRPFIEFGAPIVSVFFFISGYGLQVSYCKKGQDYLSHFFSRRFWKVLAPYLIATALYCLLTWSPDKHLGKDLLLTFTEGKPILPFSWFVVELLYFYLAFFVSFRYFSGKWRIAVMCLFMALLFFLTFRLHYGNGWWISSLAFPAGIVFATQEKRIYSCYDGSPVRYWLSLAVLTIVLALCYLGGRLLGKYYLWTICYICIPLIVALVVARWPFEKLNSKAVSFLAMVSYEIYLCQGIAMEMLRGRFHIQNDALFAVSVYALTIVLAWGVYLLAKLITSPNNRCTSSTT